MDNFALWLLAESGRLDIAGFDREFDRQLAELQFRVHDPRQRESLDRMAGTRWMHYLFAALGNAGFHDRSEREEAAHDIAVALLFRPGRLFAGYSETSGPMTARFAVSVRNAIANLRRNRARRERHTSSLNRAANAVVDPRPHEFTEDEILVAFRAYLMQHLGVKATELLDLRLDGQSWQRIAVTQGFETVGPEGVRRLTRSLRHAARRFARQHRDEEWSEMIRRRLGLDEAVVLSNSLENCCTN